MKKKRGVGRPRIGDGDSVVVHLRMSKEHAERIASLADRNYSTVPIITRACIEEGLQLIEGHKPAA